MGEQIYRAVKTDDAVFIVCGASGFIGSALLRQLSEQGLCCAAVHHDELTEDTLKDKLAPYHGRDLVLYLFAWGGASGPGRASPDVQLANINITAKAIELFAKFNLKRVIFAGSIHEYEFLERGYCAGAITTENLYSTAKLFARSMLKRQCAELKVNFVEATITNVYGVGEKSGRLIVTSLNKIKHGERLEFSAGLQFYDFIYITDAVRDLVSLGYEELELQNYVIGNGVFKPLREFLEEMCRIFGVNDDAHRTFKPWNGTIYSGIPLLETSRCVRKFFNQSNRVSFSEGIKLTYASLED